MLQAGRPRVRLPVVSLEVDQKHLESFENVVLEKDGKDQLD